MTRMYIVTDARLRELIQDYLDYKHEKLINFYKMLSNKDKLRIVVLALDNKDITIKAFLNTLIGGV